MNTFRWSHSNLNEKITSYDSKLEKIEDVDVGATFFTPTYFDGKTRIENILLGLCFDEMEYSDLKVVDALRNNKIRNFDVVT
jgi:hypothetical protein